MVGQLVDMICLTRNFLKCTCLGGIYATTSPVQVGESQSFNELQLSHMQVLHRASDSI